jgi:hypothetical protein
MQTLGKTLRQLGAFMVVILCGVSSTHAAIEVLEPGRLIIRGTIQRSDIDELARLLPVHESPDVMIFAWGTGDTAWEVVHEMSKLLEAADCTVEHHYSEDAAAAIGGMKTLFKGTLLVTNPIDINREKEINVRVWASRPGPNGTDWTSRTVTESLAPTVDRFDLHCKGRIPQEALDIGDEPHEIAGRQDDHVNRRGLRDATGEIWFYKRTGRSGTWSHEPASDLRTLVEQQRKNSEKRLDLQRRAAEKRRRTP